MKVDLSKYDEDFDHLETAIRHKQKSEIGSKTTIVIPIAERVRGKNLKHGEILKNKSEKSEKDLNLFHSCASK